ncbi:MAG: cobalamin biosynthesis protein [Deltaproteobacteria bacterium]|nr:cobalamin biosynthesis protein [Deltaproteobacteria bacterium]
MKETGITVFPVTERGYELAGRVREQWKDAIIHRPAQLRSGGLKAKVAAAFAAPRAILFISAAGIAVRSCAPFLKGKDKDPGVVVMDDAARFAVSLLSGHLGGANSLAKAVAALFGATPVITTATDVAGLPCIEEFAERLGLVVDGVRNIKRVNSAILKRGRVFVIDADPVRRAEAKKAFGPAKVFTFRKGLPVRQASGDAFVLVTPFTGQPQPARGKALMLRPREFVAGVGCGRRASPVEIKKAVGRALMDSGVSRLSLRNLASIDVKNDEQGLLAFAREAGLTIEFFTADELRRVKPPSGPSEAVWAAVNAPGVSETAAMLSAGAKRIWTKKKIFGRVTVAVARVKGKGASASSASARARKPT